MRFVPICFSCRDHGILHANRTIRSIDDLKGLRLHVPNRLAGEAIHALGAREVSFPIPQVPMAVTGHVIDGCLDPWDVVPGLRLYDLLKFHTDFAESSLSTSTFVLAMNKTAHDRLPRDLKTVIDNNSGQVAAAMAGAMWDIEAKAVADIVRDRGDPITVLAAEEVSRWRKATEPVIGAWLKQMKTHKVDGGKLIASAKTLMAKYANEPEPQATRPPEQKAVTQPPQRPDAKAQVSAMPKADAPSIPPIAKPAPPKKLDIPL